MSRPKNCPRGLKGCKGAWVRRYFGGGLTCFGLCPSGTGKVKGDILRYCNINSDGTINEVTGYTPDEILDLHIGSGAVFHEYMLSNKSYIKWRDEVTVEDS